MKALSSSKKRSALAVLAAGALLTTPAVALADNVDAPAPATEEQSAAPAAESTAASTEAVTEDSASTATTDEASAAADAVTDADADAAETTAAPAEDATPDTEASATATEEDATASDTADASATADADASATARPTFAGTPSEATPAPAESAAPATDTTPATTPATPEKEAAAKATDFTDGSPATEVPTSLVLLKDGKEVSLDNPVTAWNTLRLEFSYKLGPGHKLGQAYRISVPEGLRFPEGTTWDLKDKDGNVVAVMSFRNGELYMGLTDYVETHDEVYFSGWIEGSVTDDLTPNTTAPWTFTTNGKTFLTPLVVGDATNPGGTLPTGASKWGDPGRGLWMEDGSGVVYQGSATIQTPPVYDHGGMDVWLTDEVGPGQSIDCSTPPDITSYTGLSHWGTATGGEPMMYYTVEECSPRRIVIKTGAPQNQFLQVKIPVKYSGEGPWTNAAIVTINDASWETSTKTYLRDGGGSGGGIVPTPTPTQEPTTEPTVNPTTPTPTQEPTTEPTGEPTVAPTGEPTTEPSVTPSGKPTVEPTGPTTTPAPSGEPTVSVDVTVDGHEVTNEPPAAQAAGSASPSAQNAAASSGILAHTGANVKAFLALSLAALLGGAVLLAVRRRSDRA